MDATSWAVTIATVAFGVFVSVALGVLGVSRAHYRVARFACWGGALSLWALVTVFGITVSLPLFVRCSVVFVACGLIGVGLLFSLSWVSAAGNVGGTPTLPNMDYAVALKCSFTTLPTSAREDGPLQFIQIIGPPEQKIANLQDYVANTFQIPGSYAASWPVGMSPVSLRCTVSNFGDRAIAAITFRFGVQWHEVVHDSSGTKSGKLLSETAYDFGSLSLSPPPGQNDHFYIFSLARSYVLVLLPSEATVTFIGSNESHNIKLIKRIPADDGYWILPFVPPKDLVAKPPPSPVPPRPPAGK